MPYWSQFCCLCQGYIADALLECLPPEDFNSTTGKLLRGMQPGAALACPYCHGAIGFDAQGQLVAADPAWPVLPYSRSALELKKDADGAGPQVTLEEWALQYRFPQPGSQLPLVQYPFAP